MTAHRMWQEMLLKTYLKLNLRNILKPTSPVNLF